MKIPPREAARFCARPDPALAAVLIYGGDAMRVAQRRQALVATWLGDGSEADMRLARLDGAELRRDPAALDEAVRARGFFAGQRVVWVAEAGDALAPALKAVLDDWQDGDARVVLTAGALRPTSALRKLAEGHRGAGALAVYDDPPDRDEIARMLAAAGLRDVSPEAMADLTALAQVLEPGDFTQTLEKLALYRLDSPGAVTPADVAAVAPVSWEAGIDAALAAVAEGRVSDLPALLSRLGAQGVGAVALCIAATRHFRTLHAAASDPAGAARVWAQVKHFSTRRAMEAQARNWTLPGLEKALSELVQTDLALRSAGKPPEWALMERCLIRLAFEARRR